MRAAPALATLVVVSLALAGCVGWVANTRTAPSDADTNGSGTGPAENLTLEIVDWDARWSPGEVTVTVHVNGTVTDGGDPVAHRRVVGTVNVTTFPPWFCRSGSACPETPVDQWGVYDTETLGDGTFSAEADAQFNATYVPPIGDPYCRSIGIWAWGKAGSWQNQSVPDDTDLVDRATACTQSYP